MKTEWIYPTLTKDPVVRQSGNWEGEGSGQGTIDDVPWDYENWAVLYDELDVDGDGVPGTYDDYVQWMTDHGWADEISLP